MLTVFLSYSNVDSRLADIVEEKLTMNKKNIKISRFTSVKYRDSFREYMKSLSRYDFVFCIVSDDYLKSQACMYEVGIMLGMDDLLRRMIWVVVGEDDLKYYGTDECKGNPALIYGKETNRLNYSMYWKEQHDELEGIIKRYDNLSGSHKSVEDLNEITEIMNRTLPELLDILSDRRGLSFDNMYTNNFKDAFDAMAENYEGVSNNSGQESYNVHICQVDNDYKVYEDHIVYQKTCRFVALKGGMSKIHNRITWDVDEDVKIIPKSDNIHIEMLDDMKDPNINYNVVFEDEIEQLEEAEFCVQVIISNKNKHFKNYFSTEVIAPLESLTIHLYLDDEKVKKVYTQKIFSSPMNEKTEKCVERNYYDSYLWIINNPEVHYEYKIFW